MDILIDILVSFIIWPFERLAERRSDKRRRAAQARRQRTKDDR